MERTGMGAYQCALDADEAGDWFYRWEGSGVGQAAVEDSFRVTVSRVLPYEEEE
ncbi:MAG: hypothetical protein ACYC4R_05365 [Anaerolineae bacterium]